MVKVLLVLNGEFPTKSLFDMLSLGREVYCCDGGANGLMDIGVIPKVILGDLDSINPEVRRFFADQSEFIKYPVDKDHSDAELMLEYLKEISHDIVVVGAFGGRLDHTMFNLQLLSRLDGVRIVDEKQSVMSIHGERKLNIKEGTVASFLALSSDAEITLRGFKYSGESIKLAQGTTLGLSNIVTSEEVYVKTTSPVLLFCNYLCEEPFLSNF